MAIQEKPPDALDAVSENAPNRISRIDEAPENYGRLLEEYVQLLNTTDFNPYMPLVWVLFLSFNPRWQYRFWTSPHIRDFVKVSDAV